MAKVFLGWLGQGYRTAIEEGFAFLGGERQLRSGSRVAIKPNLTFPSFRPGVMTNPEAVEALVALLKDRGCRITICESDSGGYNRFSMDEVFRATGIVDIARRYGVRLVNLSREAAREIRVSRRCRELHVPLPALLLDETDLFVTMPVPKVHCNTVVSGAIKNQWGVIQQPALRLKLHPYFDRVIYAVNKALPATVVIMDGKYGLNRNGPMRGEPVELGWLLVSDSVVYADLTMVDLMGISHRDVPHLKFICRREGIRSLEDAVFNQDRRSFRKARFQLQRKWTDLPGFCTFHSRLLAYVGYESLLAVPLHRLLYRFREPFY